MLYIFSFLGNQMLFTQTNYNKVPSSQNYGFSSSQVWMWEMDHKEGWVPKNWCFWTVVLENTLKSPGTARRSKYYILKEINLEYSLEGLMLKLKLQYFGHLCKQPTHWKRPSFWERLKAKGERAAEDEMVGWHHWLNRYEFEQILGKCERQRILVCCSPWGHKEVGTT